MRHVTLFLPEQRAPGSNLKMARNEEKQQGRLNRLWLQREREGMQPSATSQTGIAVDISLFQDNLAAQLALAVSRLDAKPLVSPK